MILAMAQQPQPAQSRRHHQEGAGGRDTQSKCRPEAPMAGSSSSSKQAPVRLEHRQPLDKHQVQQDSKRTLIKNQLYLIEQLQLENAGLRNERDQLQLENEELKFQLQMIR